MCTVTPEERCCQHNFSKFRKMLVIIFKSKVHLIFPCFIDDASKTKHQKFIIRILCKNL